jgi:hypothetical protein
MMEYWIDSWVASVWECHLIIKRDVSTGGGCMKLEIAKQGGER